MTTKSFLSLTCAIIMSTSSAQGQKLSFQHSEDNLTTSTVGHEQAQPNKSRLSGKRPRLAVVLVFDQLRNDYLARFADQFLPAQQDDGSVGGFSWLLEQGAVYANAHYEHVPTFTGPGHAAILTGTGPSGSGIIANDWLTSTGRSMYCVQDDSQGPVGRPPGGGLTLNVGKVSPANLQAETVSDALRMATNRQGKVVGISIKDRGAILLAGHNPNAATWFDVNSGRWITSTYYTQETLPGFVENANGEQLSDQWAGRSWDLLLPKEEYSHSHPEGQAGQGKPGTLSVEFPKLMAGAEATSNTVTGKGYYQNLIISPFGNEMTFEMAKRAIIEERLGEDLIPDLLGVSFSSLDLAGHSYGPHSIEVHDMMLRLDRQLADFLNYIRLQIPGGLDSVTIVVTADHGVAPLPEWAESTMKLSSGRVSSKQIVSAAEAALAAQFLDAQTGGLITGFSDPWLFFDQPALSASRIDPAKARKVASEAICNLPGIYTTYTREEISTGRLPLGPLSHRVTNGFHPRRSGDVICLFLPFWRAGNNAGSTSHGVHYNYDTHVPIVFVGAGINTGQHTEKVDVRDIAPTLSFLLGIPQPSSSEGKILEAAREQ